MTCWQKNPQPVNPCFLPCIRKKLKVQLLIFGTPFLIFIERPVMLTTNDERVFESGLENKVNSGPSPENDFIEKPLSTSSDTHPVNGNYAPIDDEDDDDEAEEDDLILGDEDELEGDEEEYEVELEEDIDEEDLDEDDLVIDTDDDDEEDESLRIGACE